LPYYKPQQINFNLNQRKKEELNVKKIKVLSLVLCIIMLVSMALAGCSKTDSGTTDSKASGDSAKSSSESKSGGQITLSFWKAPHSDREAEYWEPILSKFMDENPNIKVEMLVTPWDTWTEKYTAAFAGGTPPDVSYMTEWYPNFADAGQLADLTPYITDEIKARYSRGSWDYATYNGKIIGIPFILVNSIIYYNKDIFEKEGINIPNTWDELIDAARKATKDLDGDGKTDQWGFAFKFMPEVDIHQIMPTIRLLKNHRTNWYLSGSSKSK
jgi:multiple sugar transport system substrate-binding protein